jgi:hypothetical protein
MTMPPGWYPAASGEPGARYWDGHNWSVVQNGKAQQGRRSVKHWLRGIGLGVLALVGVGWGVYDLSQYYVGTPTTATVTYCSIGRNASCTGTWSIDGLSQTGNIVHGFTYFPPSVGSSLNVHVTGGTGYTAYSCGNGFFFGALGGAATVASFTRRRR